MRFFSYKSVFYFVLLLLCFLIIYPYVFDTKLFLAGDNADYFSLAKGIASGKGFVKFNTPNPIPNNHFPPGYPFLMAVLMQLGINSLIAMKVFNGVMLLISSFLLFHISLRLTKNKLLSLVIGLLLLINANILQYSIVVMSEVPYMTFLLLSILLYLKNKETNFDFKSPYFYLLLAAIVLAIYTRTQGVTILGALLFVILFQKKYIAALIAFAFCFIAILPWQIRSHNLGGNSYMKQLKRIEPYNAKAGQMKFSNWTERVKLNTVRYISKEIPSSIFPAIKPVYNIPKTGKPASSPTKHWVIGYSIILLTLFGIWSTKKHRWFFLLFFGASISTNLLWPQVWFGIRFFLPMVPLTTMFVIMGGIYLIGFIIKSKTPLIESKRFVLLLGVFGLFQIPNLKELHVKSETEYAQNWKSFFTVAEWSQDNLPNDAVISCRKPGLFHMISKQKTTGFAYTDIREKFFESLDNNRVTHVVIEQLGFRQTGQYLLPIVKADPHKFKQVHAVNNQLGKTKDGTLVSSPKAVWLFEYDAKFGYQGKYVNGLKSGRGAINFRDGSKIEGTWRQDTLHGHTEQITLDGRRFSGNWVNGKKHGKILVHSKNKIIETYWIRGEIQEAGYLLDPKENRIQKIRLK